jgi:hypothetical protein
VFHISLLEPATPDATLEQDVRDIDPENQEAFYDVEKVVDLGSGKGQLQYLVRWKGHALSKTLGSLLRTSTPRHPSTNSIENRTVQEARRSSSNAGSEESPKTIGDILNVGPGSRRQLKPQT